MARSPQNGPVAFVAEIARYLCSEVEDVERMIRLDKLPHFTLPKAKRTVKRIPLRDFHAWLKKRPGSERPELANYETFLADFNRSGRPQPTRSA
ncbi:MAG: hypothetical protein V4819_19315 [Verrucomicrobiota bacterium]